MPGFFIDAWAGETAIIREDAKHIVKTMRKSVGDAITAFDGKGNVLSCTIKKADAAEVQLSVEESHKSDAEPNIAVTLYQGLVRREKMELIVQKAVELGASRIVPVLFSRCEVRELKPERLLRLNKIAREAAKQCGRAVIPQVLPAVPFKDALGEEEVIFTPYEAHRGYGLFTALEEHGKKGSYGIVIGPEGGMAPEEAEEIESRGGILVSLGKRILRTETAGMAVLAALLCHYREME
ncbi:MAG: 16S rRNA (uracil(1498)-N(3))-methyltransferase [Clostridiales bacterium]|nr:16S rRNA (uracil(1498)-N(3))-methyltransferase [Clostridiales bacterium]